MEHQVNLECIFINFFFFLFIESEAPSTSIINSSLFYFILKPGSKMIVPFLNKYKLSIIY